MANEMIMNITPGETRIARLENGVLSELSIERDSDVSVAGNVYLGRVTRVLPGMQAAFVDIGLEKAAFLYVADVVPDLFEGIDEDDELEIDKPEGLVDTKTAAEDEDNATEEDAGLEDEAAIAGGDRDAPSAEPSEKSQTDAGRTANLRQEPPRTQSEDGPPASEGGPARNGGPSRDDSRYSRDGGRNTRDGFPSRDGERDRNSAGQQGGRDGRRQGGPGRDGQGRDGRSGPSRDGGPARDGGRGRDGGGQRDSGPTRDGGRGRRPGGRPRRGPMPRIESIVKEGQTLVVQVAKEPIRTKGARITSHISLPGRYLVYMPTVNHVGISRRISSYEERQRLKRILNGNRPASGGFICRTICAGVSEEKLVDDMKSLVKIWQEIYEKQQKSPPPMQLHTDLNIVLRAVRDNLTGDVDHLVIDSVEDHKQVMEYVGQFMPELASKIELYDRETPIFDVYGIETEINRALGKKVWLRSGGYLIVESSEALTAIDVNTGRFVGKKDFEETIVTTNLEAVEEVSYQLKLRSIGGIIIIDFIDMVKYAHRMKVYNALRDALRRDRVKTTISKISELGLIEMTRKRTRESLTQMLSETCFHCNGTGFVKTPLTIAFEIFREIKRVFNSVPGRSILVVMHPRVAKVFFNEGRERLQQIEKRIEKRIVIETRETLHVESFEIKSRNIVDPRDVRSSTASGQAVANALQIAAGV